MNGMGMGEQGKPDPRQILALLKQNMPMVRMMIAAMPRQNISLLGRLTLRVLQSRPLSWAVAIALAGIFIAGFVLTFIFTPLFLLLSAFALFLPLVSLRSLFMSLKKQMTPQKKPQAQVSKEQAEREEYLRSLVDRKD